MTFRDIAPGTRFSFASAPNVWHVKTSNRRYRDAAGVVHVGRIVPVLTEGTTEAPEPEVSAPVKATPAVVADVWASRKPRWKCPTCGQWVTDEMGKRCTACASSSLHQPIVSAVQI